MREVNGSGVRRHPVLPIILYGVVDDLADPGCHRALPELRARSPAGVQPATQEAHLVRPPLKGQHALRHPGQQEVHGLQAAADQGLEPLHGGDGVRVARLYLVR